MPPLPCLKLHQPSPSTAITRYHLFGTSWFTSDIRPSGPDHDVIITTACLNGEGGAGGGGYGEQCRGGEDPIRDAQWAAGRGETDKTLLLQNAADPARSTFPNATKLSAASNLDHLLSSSTPSSSIQHSKQHPTYNITAGICRFKLALRNSRLCKLDLSLKLSDGDELMEWFIVHERCIRVSQSRYPQKYISFVPVSMPAPRLRDPSPQEPRSQDAPFGFDTGAY